MIHATLSESIAVEIRDIQVYILCSICGDYVARLDDSEFGLNAFATVTEFSTTLRERVMANLNNLLGKWKNSPNYA